MKIKNPLSKLCVSHIAWFFVGVVITVTFNWLVFKDPKRITAAGVSSLVGISAFLLALYSAHKVQLWLNSKISDKAFRHTERIIEEIEKTFLYLFKINKDTNKLSPFVALTNPEQIEIRHNIKIIVAELQESKSKIILLVDMLKYWNSKLTDEGSHKLGSALKSTSVYYYSILDYIDSIEKNKKNYHEKITAYELAIGKTLDDFNKLISISYNELFTHNVKPTSPVEKVSE